MTFLKREVGNSSLSSRIKSKMTSHGVVVSSLTDFFETDFNNHREQWEKAILAELKLTELGTKTTKKLISGATWPTLSLDRRDEVQISVQETWKKASNTFTELKVETLAKVLNEDLKGGVRNFFFFGHMLDDEKWKIIEATLKKHQPQGEIDVFILGEGSYKSLELNVISGILSGQGFHDQGGHSIQELGLLAKNLVDGVGKTSGDLYLGVYVDSSFFHNIAKIRAAKLLGQKILTETKSARKIKVVALTSFVGWTLFERYSNMLRNETAVASAYIAGADHIQSTGYNAVVEMEGENVPQSDHAERSLRMGRNTSHVLALESMLGVVEDAAYGSFHLENLTQALCEEAWIVMQKLLTGADLSREVLEVQDKRLDMIKTRKTVMSGTNDFPDVKEVLNFKLKKTSSFRSSRVFEELRLKMEGLSHKPEVYVALFGEYSALNGRLNFVKNYFELLGLKVNEPGHSQTDLDRFKKDLGSRKEEIVVFCALDDQYENLKDAVASIKTEHKFIAGKFPMDSFTNLFAGQNIYGILANLVVTFTGSKS